MTEGRWSPYPKIPSRIRLGETRAKGEWVALEKVHGANFAVVCDRTGIRPAKRRELLGEGGLDDFFGVARIWPALAVAADRCAAGLRRRHGVGAEAPVTIYGELAGGRYPHPDVPASPGTEPVQTGVWYAPGLLWLPFDATIGGGAGGASGTDSNDGNDGDEGDGKGDAGDGGLLWVGDSVLREAAAAAGLHCAPLIAHGALDRVQDRSPVFPTRVPALLGLPGLPGNLAEGLVVKPAGMWWSPAGIPAGTRPVAKSKHPAFAEDGRYDGSRPYRVPPTGAAGVPGWLLGQVTALLTPARAAAAVSKLGPRTPVEEIAAEIVRDAVEETAEALGGLEDGFRAGFGDECGEERREERGDECEDDGGDGLAAALEQALRPGALALARFDAADRRAPA
ncbi:RNA ligase family protein [Streptomyces sp. NPDC048603]|uniref:RNA ligase family protein n=1 Tax=Streptomyces sp. NPDC048603 TaxID=3365577 RepID=UPI0037198C99